MTPFTKIRSWNSQQKRIYINVQLLTMLFTLLNNPLHNNLRTKFRRKKTCKEITSKDETLLKERNKQANNFIEYTFYSNSKHLYLYLTLFKSSIEWYL